VERVWRFALPALLASMSENLLPVALNSCVSQVWIKIFFMLQNLISHLDDSEIYFPLQLVVFIGGPFVGALMDSKPRGFAFMFLSLMQVEIAVEYCI
jgi:hypothetical protein